jgi:hypothetical protein
MLNCGMDDSGVFLWALKVGSVYHLPGGKGHMFKPAGVQRYEEVTTEPGVLVQRQVGMKRATKPIFVPVSKLLIWHERLSVTPVRFDNSADCHPRGAPFSREARVQIFHTYQFELGDKKVTLCYVCGREVEMTDGGVEAHAQMIARHSSGQLCLQFEACHVTAQAHGGADDIENGRPGCHDCNIRMATTNLFDYALSMRTPITEYPAWQQSHEDWKAYANGPNCSQSL